MGTRAFRVHIECRKLPGPAGLLVPNGVSDDEHRLTCAAFKDALAAALDSHAPTPDLSHESVGDWAFVLGRVPGRPIIDTAWIDPQTPGVYLIAEARDTRKHRGTLRAITPVRIMDIWLSEGRGRPRKPK